MKLSVPASSSSPQRPQLLTRSAALLKSAAVSMRLLSFGRALGAGLERFGLGALRRAPVGHRGDEGDLEDALGDQPRPTLHADEAVEVTTADMGRAVLDVGAE